MPTAIIFFIVSKYLPEVIMAKHFVLKRKTIEHSQHIQTKKLKTIKSKKLFFVESALFVTLTVHVQAQWQVGE